MNENKTTVFEYNTETLTKQNLESIKKEEPKIESYFLVDGLHEQLSKRLHEFSFYSGLDVVGIASSLVETAKKFNTYNLAANQCGLEHRVFVAGAGEEYVAFFNPRITEYSDDEVVMEEVDITYPALQLKIKRPRSITVEYQDYTGQLRGAIFDGLSARLIQQSIDRLNGISFKSKVSKLVLERATKARSKKVKKYVRAMMSYRSVE